MVYTWRCKHQGRSIAYSAAGCGRGHRHGAGQGLPKNQAKARRPASSRTQAALAQGLCQGAMGSAVRPGRRARTRRRRAGGRGGDESRYATKRDRRECVPCISMALPFLHTPTARYPASVLCCDIQCPVFLLRTLPRSDTSYVGHPTTSRLRQASIVFSMQHITVSTDALSAYFRRGKPGSHNDHDLQLPRASGQGSGPEGASGPFPGVQESELCNHQGDVSTPYRRLHRSRPFCIRHSAIALYASPSVSPYCICFPPLGNMYQAAQPKSTRSVCIS